MATLSSPFLFMKSNYLIWFATAAFILVGESAFAEDKFPAFRESAISVTIPTNFPGFVQDSTGEKQGTNVVYHAVGQIFTNASQGHIQLKGEGFSGSSDRSTPWKTLTELISVYQAGSPHEEIRSLHASSAKKIIDDIFKNEAMKSRYQSFGQSVTNAQAVLWLHESGGGIAYLRLDSRDGRQSVLPYYLEKNGNRYEVAVGNATSNTTNNMVSNLINYLSNKYSTNATGQKTNSP
jgi:hypothetical protein